MKAKTYSTVGWKKYLTEDDQNPQAATYLHKNGIEIFSEIIKLISHAWQYKKKYIPIIHFSKTCIISVVKHEEYIDVLDHARKWFEKREEYEKCSEIRNLIAKIKGYES